jgi:hypothetical protein
MRRHLRHNHPAHDMFGAYLQEGLAHVSQQTWPARSASAMACARLTPAFFRVRLPAGALLLIVLIALAFAVIPFPAHAQDAAAPGAVITGTVTGTVGVTGTVNTATDETTVRATRVTGALPNQFSAHYLGLQPAERDGTVVLTLRYDPQDPQIEGLVNFLVLTEDGLRRFLAGEDPAGLEVAAGSPLAVGDQRNVLQGALLDSGRGNYTVIVYNESQLPVTYELIAQNGVLLDAAGQIAADEADRVAAPTPTPAPIPYSSAVVTGRRLSGELDGAYERHYLAVAPEVVDGQVRLKLNYEPLDRPELAGAINFWVLDEDGVRRLVRGDDPGDINLATGFPSPFDPTLGQLEASFTSSGDNEYTAVLYNISGVIANYALGAEGALLVDRYAQTNEALAAAAEAAALASASAAATVTPTPTPLPPTEIEVGEPELPTTARPNRVTGALNTAFEQHYLGLVPDVTDGTVTVVLDYDPKDSEALRNNVNFWVIDQDGLRRVVSGGRPEDYALATGAVVPFGADEGKLRAEFTSSGRNEYTLIVYNHSEVPATYALEIHGGGLEDNLGQVQPLIQ